MNIGLVAHDERKGALQSRVVEHQAKLAGHHVILISGATGARLKAACSELEIHCLKKGGPLSRA